MKIYSMFYISLLKSADSEILTIIQRSSKLLRYKKYEIEDIKEYDPETQRYTVKWKEYLTEENLWEPLKSLDNCQQILKKYWKRTKNQI